jgi:seryl-tRNA synthetase
VTQVNIQCLVPGRLDVRPGTQAASFVAHTGGTSPIVSALRYPNEDAIVYQNADGSITVPEALRPYMGGVTRIARA